MELGNPADRTPPADAIPVTPHAAKRYTRRPPRSRTCPIATRIETHTASAERRRTLATQAVNRGMSIDAIAALLGHKSLAMTMVYARIADKTVAEEYFSVSTKVESLYGQPRSLPANHEGRRCASFAPRCTAGCSATGT